MSVSGKYVATFAEASHCVFDGHLDDPSFRSIAIQKIISLTPEAITLGQSGILRVGKHRATGKQCVGLRYRSFFGTVSTYGYPFKDENTAIPPSHPESPPESSGQPEQPPA